MKLAFLRMPHKGHIVRLHGAGQERGHKQVVVVGINHLLRQLEAQHLLQQVDSAVHIVTVEQAVVEPGRAHALEILGPRLGVALMHAPLAALFFLGIQLEIVTRGRIEPQPLAAALQLPGRNHLDAAAVVD